jgi:metal-responsive CopG/Arc/MetJ family transcriptional regulator
MKTAISVDDHLLQDADQAAREMGLSRSRLFSVAMEAYLRHRKQEEITDQLNQVYGDHPDPEERSLSKRMRSKFHSTIRDRW